MALIAFLDETGDHLLTTVDPGFPVFVLMLMIFDTQDYINGTVPAVLRLKFDYWRHEGIILHSRDIRKAQGDFGFLTTPDNRQPFYERLNQIMREGKYALISVGIHKAKLVDRYSSPMNPYDLALEFALERLIRLMEERSESKVTIVAEARGNNEDSQLRETFERLLSRGTDYVVKERILQRIDATSLVFKEKKMNITGTQLADLTAYPTARSMIGSSTESRAIETFRDKFYASKFFP